LEGCIYSCGIHRRPQRQEVNINITERCTGCLDTARVGRNIYEANKGRRRRRKTECLRISTVWCLTDCEGFSQWLHGHAWLNKDVGGRSGERKGKSLASDNHRYRLSQAGYTGVAGKGHRKTYRMGSGMRTVVC